MNIEKNLSEASKSIEMTEKNGLMSELHALPEQLGNVEEVEHLPNELSSESFETMGTEYGETNHYDDDGKLYRTNNELKANTEFTINGYNYKTDNMGRVVLAEGTLQLKNHKGRNEMPDSRDIVAHGKMSDSDDRGHLIADRFNGSGELENLVPMDSKLNRGDYAKLEGTWADASRDGATVKAVINPIYSDNTHRPSEFRVFYSINSDKEVVVFKNRSEK